MNDYEKKQAARRSRILDLARGAKAQSAAASDAAHKIASRIEPGQPILVGHHSEGRHRRDLARMDSNMRKSVEAERASQELARKAAAVGTGGVSSDDPDAIAKLTREIEQGEGQQAFMKSVNRAINGAKKQGRPAQLEALLALGLTEARAEEALTPDHCGRVGFADYLLTNNSANLRRLRQRVADLEARRERAPVVIEAASYTYREDSTENRVMFEFAGKPVEAVRKLLSAAAFKWAPSRGEAGAWVRFLTTSGIDAGREVRAALDAMAPGAIYGDNASS